MVICDLCGEKMPMDSKTIEMITGIFWNVPQLKKIHICSKCETELTEKINMCKSNFYKEKTKDFSEKDEEEGYWG